MGPIPRCPARTDRSSRGASPHALSSCHLRSGVNGAETRRPHDPHRAQRPLRARSTKAGAETPATRDSLFTELTEVSMLPRELQGPRAASFQTLDLLLQQLLVHRELADLRLEVFDLFVALVARTRVQCGLGAREETDPAIRSVWLPLRPDRERRYRGSRHVSHAIRLRSSSSRRNDPAKSRLDRFAPTDPLVALLMLDSPFRPTVGQRSVQENPGAMDFLLCISQKKGNQ